MTFSIADTTHIWLLGLPSWYVAPAKGLAADPYRFAGVDYWVSLHVDGARCFARDITRKGKKNAKRS